MLRWTAKTAVLPQLVVYFYNSAVRLQKAQCLGESLQCFFSYTVFPFNHLAEIVASLLTCV